MISESRLKNLREMLSWRLSAYYKL